MAGLLFRQGFPTKANNARTETHHGGSNLNMSIHTCMNNFMLYVLYTLCSTYIYVCMYLYVFMDFYGILACHVCYTAARRPGPPDPWHVFGRRSEQRTFSSKSDSMRAGLWRGFSSSFLHEMRQSVVNEWLYDQ